MCLLWTCTQYQEKCMIFPENLTNMTCERIRISQFGDGEVATRKKKDEVPNSTANPGTIPCMKFSTLQSMPTICMTSFTAISSAL